MTDSKSTPTADLARFLSRFPAGIVALTKKCLPKLRGAFPGTNEIVYDYAKSVVISFSESERGYEAIVSLAILPEAVRLYFDKTLPDPKRILEGSGSKVRSITIESASDFDDGDIHDLIKAAIRHSGFKPGKPSTKGRMIIQTDGAKRKPKKST